MESSGCKNIIIVEQDPSYRDRLRYMVSQTGDIAFCFQHETACLDNLSQLDPALIVMGSYPQDRSIRFMNALRAIDCHLPVIMISEDPVVLLVDEVDKSDPEFEAFLLEVLSDYQISIPEIGTRKAINIPFVVLTSNNYRDMSDALKRRCLHLYIDYPDIDLEREIVRMKIPTIPKKLADQLVAAIHAIRDLDLKKKPSISETLDWASSLMALQVEALSAGVVSDTLSAILKYRIDADVVRKNLDKVLVH